MRGVKKSNYVKEFLKVLFKADRTPAFVYPIIRLMLPSDDRARGNYGLKEKNLSKVISDSLNLTKEDYLRLHHYKNPSFHKNGIGIGDFSLCVHDVVKSYCKQQYSLTITDLNDMLDELVNSKGQLNVFRRMFVTCTAEEIKWIIRIILKDLKINVKIDTVLKAYHPDSHDYFNLTNSLWETCKKFEDPNVSLDDEVKMFFPIRPMLAGKKKISFF
jgi:DNA ligase 4